MPVDRRAWKGNMGKNHVRRAEYEIFEFHMRIDRHGISKPARVAYNGVPLDVGVLAETTVFADQGARRDVRKMPYLGVFSDCRTVFHHRGSMYKRPRSFLLDFSQSLFLSWRVAKRTSNSASRPLAELGPLSHPSAVCSIFKKAATDQVRLLAFVQGRSTTSAF
jgi:hypothetical protein